MPSLGVAKVTRWILFVGSFVVLLPVAAWIADPLATRTYDPSIDTCVLLFWPDHIELHKMSAIAEVSPRPSNAAYTFLIPPQRLAWVRERLAVEPHGNNDAGWMIRTKDLGPKKQRIELQIMGDGYWGMVYEAGPERIIPMGTRRAGPGFAFIFFAIDVAIWGCFWILVYIFKRTLSFRKRQMAMGVPA